MSKQLIFGLFLLLSLGLFTYTVFRLVSFFRLTKKGFKVDRISERITTTLLVAFGQTKILRRPAIGLMHALVYWGFMVITIGSLEMMIDGLAGTERIFGSWGILYDFITASGDVFAAIIILSCFAFLVRRHVMKVKRFSGVEMTTKSSMDATAALTMILILMFSLIGMNTGYLVHHSNEIYGSYPISSLLTGLVSVESAHMVQETNWWIHICLIFIFLNILPHSVHVRESV